MLNKSIIFFCFSIYFSFSSICSAEITKKYDQFNNIFTIAMTKSMPINDNNAILKLSTSKSYKFDPTFYNKSKQEFTPIISIDFSVLDTKYWWFEKNFNYLVEGDPLAKRQTILTSHYKNNNNLFVMTTGTVILSDEHKFTKILRTKKKVTIQLLFSNASPFIFYLSPETLDEINQILDFDLKNDPEFQKALNKK